MELLQSGIVWGDIAYPGWRFAYPGLSCPSPAGMNRFLPLCMVNRFPIP